MEAFWLLCAYVLLVSATSPYQYTPNPQNGCYYQVQGYYGVPICPGTDGQQEQGAATAVAQPQKAVQPSNNVVSEKKVLNITVDGNSDQSLPEKLSNTNPALANMLKKIFEYHGIMKPWDPFRDLVSVEQQRLPDPCMLYIKMKDILKVFESLKEIISDELLKVETYVKRAKSYLKEDQENLEHNLERMKRYMKKIKKTKSDFVKSDYARKFDEVRAETRKTIACYQKLKKWLASTLSYFKMLF